MRWYRLPVVSTRAVLAGAVLAAPIALTPAAHADGSALTVLFHVRPPYSGYDTNQHVTGILIEPVAAAATGIDVTVKWVETPPARQTEEIKRATGPICGLGWFKRPEREAFARFTAPIYRDQPVVIVTRKDDARFADGMSLHDAFRDTDRTLVMKTGYSYGVMIDGWIKELQPRAVVSAEANDALLHLITLKRGDYLIMAPEEASHLLATEPILGGALHIVTLGDAPPGEFRYLMCSRATPPELIERINGKLPIPASP